MSVGPAPCFHQIGSDHIDVILAAVNAKRPNKDTRNTAEAYTYALIVDANDMAQAASDLLYLLENDAPDSCRIDTAIARLHQTINSPHDMCRAVENRIAGQAVQS